MTLVPTEIVTDAVLVCGATYASCICNLPDTHVEQPDTPHECCCHGAWFGDDRSNTKMIPIRWPVTGIETGLDRHA